MFRISNFFSLTAMLVFCLQSVASSAPLHNNGDLTQKLLIEDTLIVPVGGCHANNRYHYVDEIDDDANHRHRGNSCRVELQRAPEHCHRKGQRHRHSGYGKTTHSHFQRNCEVDVWNERKNHGGSNRGCVKIGPVLFCQ